MNVRIVCVISILCLLFGGPAVADRQTHVSLPMVGGGGAWPGQQALLESRLYHAHRLGEAGRCEEAVALYESLLRTLGHPLDDLGEIEADVMLRYGLTADDLATDCGRWLVLDQYVKWLIEQGTLWPGSR